EEVWRNAILLGLVVGALAQRFALAEGLLRDVLLLPVRDRLGDVQLRLAIMLSGTRPALSRSQLARLVQARPETLARVPARHAWAAECSDAPVRLAPLREFRAGDVLADVDAPPGHVNQLVDGQLQIALAGDDKRQVSMSTLQAGDFVGISGLVGLPPTGLRAFALADGAVRTLCAHEFLRDIATEPAALRRLAQQLEDGLMQVERQLSFAATRTVRQRLVAYLRDMDRQSVEPGRPL